MHYLCVSWELAVCQYCNSPEPFHSIHLDVFKSQKEDSLYVVEKSFFVILLLIEPTINSSLSIPGSQHQTILNDKPPMKTPLPTAAPPDPFVDELRKLSRDLTAIRLQVDKYVQGSEASHEWQMIGMVVDRLLFGLYIVFIGASFITIMGIWIWNNTYTD